MRRFCGALCAILAFIVSACSGDGASGPPAESGLYRLVAVNGQPVPYSRPPSLGLSYTISHADLLLRPDGSFAWGMGDPFLRLGLLSTGRWRVTGGTLRLTGEGGSEITATAGGDSILLSLQDELLFRRTAMPQPPIASGTYILSSVNGRSDLAYEYQVNDERMVERVSYDTITFLDGVFYRWAREERQVRYLAGGDSLEAMRAWVTFGSYTGTAGELVLRGYGPPAEFRVRAADTLAIETGALVRRVPRVAPLTGQVFLWEDRYTRRN